MAIWRETGTRNAPSLKYKVAVLVESHVHLRAAGELAFVLNKLLAHNPTTTSEMKSRTRRTTRGIIAFLPADSGIILTRITF